MLTVTDLFCGAGGASEGLRQAGLRVMQAVNHDALAIAAHEANHPHTAHFVEDITALDAGKLAHTDVLWASLECTNFSNAKGGKPRDADSRSLADHMPRYILAIQPDYFVVENVREFMAWGPLDANGKPVSRTKGIDFVRWFAEIEALGYRGKYRLLNAADYGARTTRTRLFIAFTRYGLAPLDWPEPTHSKGGKVPGTLPWLPVADCLELNTPGESIFTRKKSLSEKTLQRLLAGLIKYVAIDPPAFLLQNNFTNTAADLARPSKAATTNGGNQFLVSYHSNGDNVRHISQPAPTARTRDGQALAQPWLMKYLSNPPSGKPNPGLSVTEPGPTATTQDRIALAQPFLLQYNSGADAARCQALGSPAGVVPTANRFGLAQPFMLQNMNGQTPYRCVDLGRPSKAITCSGGNLYVASPFLLNPGWFGCTSPLHLPGPVVVARQDKAPLSACFAFLDKRFGSGSHNHQPITVPSGAILTNDHHVLAQVERAEQPEPACWAEQPGDTATMQAIRFFCRHWFVADVRMRMLFVSELSRIQGFPEGYVLTGGQTNAKKQLGNAVEVKVATALGRMLAAAEKEEATV